MVLLSILPALAHHSLNPAAPDEDEAGAGAVDEGATVVPLLPPSSEGLSPRRGPQSLARLRTSAVCHQLSRLSF